MSGNKNKKVRHSRETVSSNDWYKYMLTMKKLLDNLLKAVHHAGFKKLNR